MVEMKQNGVFRRSLLASYFFPSAFDSVDAVDALSSNCYSDRYTDEYRGRWER